MKLLLCAAPLLATLTAPLLAQSTRPVAFTNARLLTMDGAPIERGTLVVRNGLIEAIGADVAPPAGAEIVDCDGGTILPGFVSAFSRAGLQAQPSRSPTPSAGRRSGRRGMPAPRGGGGGSANAVATKIVDRLDPGQDVFGELLQQGVTTLALTPPGNGFPGLGALLRPDGKNLDELTDNDEAFVFIGAAADSTVKKMLKENFEKAKQALEERKKPKEEPKEEAKTPAGKPGEKPGEQPADKPAQPAPAGEGEPGEGGGQPEARKPQAGAQKPQQAAKKDPNIEVLADLLDGKRRAFVQIDSAAELLHYNHATGGEVEFPRAVVVTRHDPRSGTLDMVLDAVKKLKAPLLLPPTLATRPDTAQPTNPARVLHDAGVEVGFLVGDDPRQVEGLRVQLMELVRAGLPRDVALRGVTSVPAKMLGIDDKTGSLTVGKQADLMVLSADPLDPTASLRSVWLRGKRVSNQTP